ncbi:bacteriophage protein [Shigella sonnei]|nr:bacteriophage protein [Shigella sonnei]
MTEAEILGLIRRVAGISQQVDEQAMQPDSVTAENYARVVDEVMRRDGIELNGVDMRNIPTMKLRKLPVVWVVRVTPRFWGLLAIPK